MSGFPFSTTNVASSAPSPPPTFLTAWTALAGTINASPALTVLVCSPSIWYSSSLDLRGDAVAFLPETPTIGSSEQAQGGANRWSDSRLPKNSIRRGCGSSPMVDCGRLLLDRVCALRFALAEGDVFAGTSTKMMKTSSGEIPAAAAMRVSRSLSSASRVS